MHKIIDNLPCERPLLSIRVIIKGQPIKMYAKAVKRNISRFSIAIILLPILLWVIFSVPHRVSAACQAPSTDYGTVTTNVTVPNAATYRIWSRAMAAGQTNNSFLLEVDGNTCYTIGGNALSNSAWTWVDYRDGNTASKTDLVLQAGNHTIKMIGNKPDVKIDRLLLLSDRNCIPVNNGDNCNTPTDSTAPNVALTSPTDSSKVSGTIPISANTSDNIGVTKVEFYVDSTLLGTDSSSPYAFNWNTSTIANGQHRITVKAYDAANNVSNDTLLVDVQNGDTQAPTVPMDVKATVSDYNRINVTWTASTDNVAIAGYIITRNDMIIAQLGTVTSFDDTTVQPDTQYAYRVTAIDTAGNKSNASAAATVKTPVVPDTQPPSIPGDITATAVSQTQINLKWQPSTDNIGVAGYEVYRVNGQTQTKIATVASPSFGISGLNPNTSYSFALRAKDAAGNTSALSTTVTAKTLSPPTTTPANSILYGSIRDSRTNRPINKARVVVEGTGTKRIFSSFGRGYYILYGLSAGRYTITYSAPGYASKTITYTIGTNSFQSKNIKLDRR